MGTSDSRRDLIRRKSSMNPSLTPAMDAPARNTSGSPIRTTSAPSRHPAYRAASTRPLDRFPRGSPASNPMRMRTSPGRRLRRTAFQTAVPLFRTADSSSPHAPSSPTRPSTRFERVANPRNGHFIAVEFADRRRHYILCIHDRTGSARRAYQRERSRSDGIHTPGIHVDFPSMRS